MPYSCHAQFGTSGSRGCPIGGGSTARGIAAVGLQFSTLTMVHTATRASLGSLSAGLRWIGVWGNRPRTLLPINSVMLFSFPCSAFAQRDHGDVDALAIHGLNLGLDPPEVLEQWIDVPLRTPRSHGDACLSAAPSADCWWPAAVPANAVDTVCNTFGAGVQK